MVVKTFESQGFNLQTENSARQKPRLVATLKSHRKSHFSQYSNHFFFMRHANIAIASYEKRKPQEKNTNYNSYEYNNNKNLKSRPLNKESLCQATKKKTYKF